jgi:hypothetical protein
MIISGFRIGPKTDRPERRSAQLFYALKYAIWDVVASRRPLGDHNSPRWSPKLLWKMLASAMARTRLVSSAARSDASASPCRTAPGPAGRETHGRRTHPTSTPATARRSCAGPGRRSTIWNTRWPGSPKTRCRILVRPRQSENHIAGPRAQRSWRRAASARTAWLAEMAPAGATMTGGARQTPRWRTSRPQRCLVSSRSTSAGSSDWP